MRMATAITSSHFFFLLICISNVSSSYLANIASSKTNPVKPRRLAIKLIHHNSIQSPCYNSNATVSERAERAIIGSLARIRSLSKIIATPNDDDVRDSLSTNAHGLLANVSIGTPPVPQLVLIDTASELLWFQCLPCTSCFKQSPPFFDPTKSSTYSNIRCHSVLCSISRGKCDPNNEYCVYERWYLDSTTTAGNLASERATFETSDEGTVQVLMELLGCGHENKYTGAAQESGILGLSYGYGNLPTLVKQFGSTFSYCIGNINDPQYRYNQLILGDGAILQGDSTTLETDNFYYVELQGISVGEKKLPIDPGAFERRPSGEGGVIIDTGSTYTFLKEEGYVPLRDEVERLMAGKLNRVSHPWFLCYAGSIERDLTGFPVVTLQFAGGAELSLDINSLFFQLTAKVLCMAVLQSYPDTKGQSFIGVMAQQYYNVGYDVKQGKVYFQRIDCDVLESLV